MRDLPDTVDVAITRNADGIRPALQRFLDTPVDAIALCGGDGTNHAALTALGDLLDPGTMPPIALLRGGTMNTIANALGIVGTPRGLLDNLIGATQPIATRPTGLIRVDDGTRVRRGFLFGTGLMARFLQEYYRAPDPSPTHAALTLARAVAGVPTGGAFARRLLRPDLLQLQHDEQPWPIPPCRGLLASTVPEIGLGFTPFPRCDERAGAFHTLAVVCPPMTLVGALPAIYRGTHCGHPGIPDRVVSRLSIHSDEGFPFVLDGDVYPCRGALVATWDRSVPIVQPPRRHPVAATVDRLLGR